MSATAPVPCSTDDFTKSWFNIVFDGRVRDMQLLKIIHGTATKVHAELKLEGEAEPRTQRVWVKTGLEPHSQSMGNDIVYAGETFFYRTLAGQYETRTPRCFYAESDAAGRSAIVLDDLAVQGAQFAEPAQAGTPELVASGLEAIARYQAASWMRQELYDNVWLRNGGSFTAANCLGWIWAAEHWQAYQARPRFARIAPQLRDRTRLLHAHTLLQTQWRQRAPWALSHGDAHFGQLYMLPSGEARLIDWQCVQIANYMQDVSYFLIGGLSVEDRRRHARDLLAHYLDRLAEFGVPNPPKLDEAWPLLPVYLVHGMSWAMCLVELQPEENCEAMTERFSTAMVELRSFEALGV